MAFFGFLESTDADGFDFLKFLQMADGFFGIFWKKRTDADGFDFIKIYRCRWSVKKKDDL